MKIIVYSVIILILVSCSHNRIINDDFYNFTKQCIDEPSNYRMFLQSAPFKIYSRVNKNFYIIEDSLMLSFFKYSYCDNNYTFNFDRSGEFTALNQNHGRDTIYNIVWHCEDDPEIAITFRWKLLNGVWKYNGFHLGNN